MVCSGCQGHADGPFGAAATGVIDTHVLRAIADQVGDDPSVALGAIGLALGAVRTYAVEFDPVSLGVGRCHEWSAPGVAKRSDADDAGQLSLQTLGLAPWAATIARGASVVKGLGEASRAAPDEIARHGVSTIALVPIELDGACWGLVGADFRADASSTQPLPPQEAVLLALRGLSGAVARNVLQRRLEHERGFAVGMLAEVPGGILVTDARSRVQYVNRAAAEILGYTPTELLFLSADELMDEAEAERLRAIRARRRQGQVTTYQVRVRHKNGEPRDLMITGAPRYRDRTFIGTLSNIVDITASNLVVQEIARAKEAAERVKEAAAVLVSQLSHELRTPLHSILGYARLLASDELSADQRESVGEIVRAGDHMARLIEAAFDVASIEAKGPPLELRPVPLRDLLEEVVSMLRVLAGARGIRIEIDVPRQGPHFVMADRLRLKQVIVNLLANAVKYSRPSGTVGIGCGASGAASVRLEIRDAGVGIPAEKMARLFVAFDRLGAESGSDGAGGSGLGLAVTKALVDMMGGSIDVQSVDGQGTTVGVTLAAAAATEHDLVPVAS
jgi:PAS domain S-box-containing protein